MSCRKKVFFFCCIVSVISCLSSCSLKARIKKADKKFYIGEYYDANTIYSQCYNRVSAKKDKPLKAYLAFQQGECNRILNNTAASNHYKHAINYKYPDSIVFLRYAQTLHFQGKDDEALKNYTIYEQSHPDDYVAVSGVEACDKKANWRIPNEDYSQYTVKYSKEFNKKSSSTICPAFAGSETGTIYLTSNRVLNKSSSKKTKRNSAITGKPYFAVYMAKSDIANRWGEVEKVEGMSGNEEDSSEGSQEGESNDSVAKPEKSKLDMGVCSFSPDGKLMYLTYSCPINGQDLGAKVYVSIRTSNEWSEPKPVMIFKDSSITVAHPSLNATGDTMYFVSNAPGGYGGMDIWLAEYNGSSWENPQNLGPAINTSENEMFPYIRHDGVLFFSSLGHPGYGGLDIFEATRDTFADVKLDDSLHLCNIGWKVRNVGKPFNSNADDFGMVFSDKSNRKGYFSSNRAHSQKKPGKVDEIYSFERPELVLAVLGKVKDNAGEVIDGAFVRIIGDDGTNTKIQVRKDGNYKFKLHKDTRYAMLGGARGYLNQMQEISTTDIKNSKTLTQDFSLSPVFKPVPMDNVFYEFGKWELTKETEKGLQFLIKLLNDNPNITIELSAHTDIVGDAQFNLELSQKRAKAVVDFLIKNGIEAERLTPVGYGKTKPVSVDDKLHMRYPFLPIGQELNEEYVLSLDAQKQDICNQINRRTEFKVLKTTYKLY